MTSLHQVMDRKVKKPIMEKRRRARINQCLEELKKLLLHTHSPSTIGQQRGSKLEKADILEMTVRFVKSKSDHDDDSSSRRAFVRGFIHCTQAIVQLLPHLEHNPILSHLTMILNERLGEFDDRIPSSSTLTLSIPKGYTDNQASQPTPPFTLSTYPCHNAQIQTTRNTSASSLISPSSTSISDGCDSPFSCSSNGGYCSSSNDGNNLLLTPIKTKHGERIWRPW